MSRTTKSSKGPGHEYWSRRNNYNTTPGKESKIRTHRWDRRQGRVDARKAVEE